MHTYVKLFFDEKTKESTVAKKDTAEVPFGITKCVPV